MNPLRWTREHLVAWVATIALGASVGLLLGWLWSPFSRAQGAQVGTFFFFWVQYPDGYWPWLAFGAVIAALAFYAAKLLMVQSR